MSLSDYFTEPGIVRLIEEYASRPMILQFKINKKQDYVQINLTNPTNITTDWGDGVVDNKLRHYYSKNGLYTVEIYGNCTSYIIEETSYLLDNNLIRVLSYGDFRLTKIVYKNCRRLIEVPNYLPPTVTDTSNMFMYCHDFNQSLSFDTRNVTNMSNMFHCCYYFNQALNFDTRNVTDMSYMFSYCKSFNQPLNFDTRNVTNMSNMFHCCYHFNQPLNFDTRNVTDMSNMFSECEAFNRPIYFDVYNITKIDDMFYLCRSLRRLPLFYTAKIEELRELKALLRSYQ